MHAEGIAFVAQQTRAQGSAVYVAYPQLIDLCGGWLLLRHTYICTHFLSFVRWARCCSHALTAQQQSWWRRPRAQPSHS